MTHTLTSIELFFKKNEKVSMAFLSGSFAFLHFILKNNWQELQVFFF